MGNNKDNKQQPIPSAGIVTTKPSALEIDYLYRGDGRSPPEIFTNGFTARGKNLDLLSHVNPIGRYSSKDSGYVSTSLSRWVATSLARPNSGDIGYVYSINPIRGVNVPISLADAVQHGLLDAEDYSVIVLEREIAVKGKINPKDIKGAWSIRWKNVPDEFWDDSQTKKIIENSATPFTPNPLYREPFLTRIARVGHYFGRGATMVGMGVDGINLYQAYRLSQLQGYYGPLVLESSRIAAGWGAATAAGVLAAKTGAWACMPFGPVASLGCSFGAGVTASIAGYHGGSKIMVNTLEEKLSHPEQHTPIQASFVEATSTNKPSSYIKPEKTSDKKPITTPLTTQKTSPINEPVKESIEMQHAYKKIEELTEIMDAMFDAYSDEDISGFEEHNDILGLHIQLQELKKRKEKGEPHLSAQISTLTKSLQSEKAKIVAEKTQLITKYNNAKQIFSGVTQLIGLANNEIGSQISVIGNSIISFVENGATLLGINTFLAASVHPVLALANVATAIANIVGLFGKKDDANPHMAIMNMIMSLSAQINRLFEINSLQLQEISHQIAKNQWVLLEKFREVSKSQLEAHTLMRLMYFEIRHGFSDQSARLSEIMDMLSVLQSKLTGQREDFDKLKEIVRFILTNTKLDFNVLANQLDHLAFERGITSQISDPIQLSKVKHPANYFQMGNYFSTLINQSETKITTPSIVIYAALANILLNLKEYPLRNSEHISDRIATKDIQRLQDYQDQLKSINTLSQQARESTLHTQLISEYDKAINKLSQEVRRITAKLENRYTQDKLVIRTGKTAEQRSENLRRFNRPFEVDTFDWFKGTHIHISRRHQSSNRILGIGRRGRWTGGPTSEAYVHIMDKETTKLTGREKIKSFASGKSTYLKERDYEIENQREQARFSASETFSFSQKNKLSIFNTPSVSDYHGVPFIQSKNNKLPDLPAPHILLPKNHPHYNALYALQKAQAFGLGNIVLQYSISEDNNFFNLHILFHLFTEDLNLDIATFRFNYTPSFYKGAEAIWNFWIGGNLVPKLKGETKELYEGITANFAMNGGGWGHKRGEFDADQWIIEIPESKIEHKGMLDQYYHDNIFTVNSIESENVKKITLQIDSIQSQMKKEYSRELLLELDVHRNDEIGKTYREVELTLHHLYGTLSWGYYDLMQDPNSTLSLWFSQHIAHVEKLKSGNLDKAPWLILHELKSSLIDLPLLLSKATDSTIHNTLLVETQEVISQFIDLYSPFSVSVNRNRLSTTEMDVEAKTLANLATTLAKNLFETLPFQVACDILDKTAQEWMEAANVNPVILDSIISRLKKSSNQHPALGASSFDSSEKLSLPAAATVEDLEKECTELSTSSKRETDTQNAIDLCQHLFGKPTAITQRPVQALKACAEISTNTDITSATTSRVTQLFNRLCSVVITKTIASEAQTSSTLRPR